MNDPTPTAFIGDIPRYYDANLGPILFEDYAREIAERAAALRPANVLEIAAGTGIVSRQLRNALPRVTSLVVTDLNPPMLEIAKAKFSADETVSFEPADAAALRFSDSTFDLIVCQFGYMFLPDKGAAFREAHRVLKTEGHLLFSTWAPTEANPFSHIVHDLSGRFAPEDQPTFYRVPFSYGDEAIVRADLSAAGFAEVSCDHVKHQRLVADWAPFAKGLVYGNPLVAELHARNVAPDDVVTALVDALSAHFGAAPTTMPLEALIFSARKT